MDELTVPVPSDDVEPQTLGVYLRCPKCDRSHGPYRYETSNPPDSTHVCRGCNTAFVGPARKPAAVDPVRSDAGKSDTVEWENPVWPDPPGDTPRDTPSTCGLYVVSMYGLVHMASIHHPLIDNVPHVSIWDRTGRPVRGWNHEPMDRFRNHADSLYTAWKPLTLPESWQDCAK